MKYNALISCSFLIELNIYNKTDIQVKYFEERLMLMYEFGNCNDGFCVSNDHVSNILET